MPSTDKIQWDFLLNRCEQAGLRVPVMSPSVLGDKISIAVYQADGTCDFRASASTVEASIDRALVYVMGYKHAQRDAQVVDSPEDLRHQCWLACSEIVQSEWSTADTKKLARAILAANIAASLETK